MKNTRFLLIAITVLFFSCGAYAQNQGYHLRRGDVLDVLVMDHSEFSINNIIVLPDGTIQYPGFGHFEVAGMAPHELRDSLEFMLQRYVVNPIVSVFVRRLQEEKINVLGYVRRPDQHQVFEPIDLFSAVSRSGGIPNIRRVRGIYIIRQDNTVIEVASNRFEARRLFINPDFDAQDLPYLYTGDTLYIVEPRDVNWSRLSFFASFTATVFSLIRWFL